MRSSEVIYDGSGQEVSHRLDTDKCRMILAPDCRDRLAVSAFLSMHENALRHERGQPFLDESESLSNAAGLELALHNLGIELSVLDSINALVHDSAPRRKLHPRLWVGLGVAAALALASILINYPPSFRAAEQPQAAFVQPATVPYSLTEGMTKSMVPFEPEALAVGIHPSRPAFVVADADRQVYLAHPIYGKTQLASTPAPVYWLNVSPDGTEAVTCDWSGTITIVPLELDRGITSFRTDTHISRAYALGEGQVLCVNDAEGLVWIMGREGTEQLVGVSNAIPATSNARLLGQEKIDASGVKYMNVYDLDAPDDPILSRRLVGTQFLLSFDFSRDRSIALVCLSDGTLAMYRRERSAYVSSEEFNFGSDYFLRSVQVSPSGEIGWVGHNKLSRWNLATFKPTAFTQLDMENRDFEVIRRVQDESGGRILIATTQIGSIWE